MHNLDSDSLRAQADHMEKAGRILLETAGKVREAADALDSLSQRNGQSEQLPFFEDKPETRKTRPEQLRDWLRGRGHMRRKDILSGCDMPRGTVSVILKEEHGFEKDEEGRWYVPG